MKLKISSRGKRALKISKRLKNIFDNIYSDFINKFDKLDSFYYVFTTDKFVDICTFPPLN